MSTAASTTGQITTMPWDTLKITMKDSADQFVDAAQPHVATLLKTTGAAVLAAGANAGSPTLKALVAANCPASSPVANVVIDTTTAPVVALLAERSSPAIDTSAQKVGEVAKDASHKAIDCGVDLSARSVSFFGPTS